MEAALYRLWRGAASRDGQKLPASARHPAVLAVEAAAVLR
jgi:hypothetical protein